MPSTPAPLPSGVQPDLQSLCYELVDGALGGDVAAQMQLDAIKTQALAGDEAAQTLWDGVRHAYWSRSSTSEEWAKAQDLYDALVQGNKQASDVCDEINRKAETGDEDAVKWRGRLRTIHGYSQPNALFPSGPGAPRFGGYGMPTSHRAGIIVGKKRHIVRR